MAATAVVLVVLLLAAAIAGIIWVAVRHHKRIKRLEAWADTEGWRFEAIDKRLERSYRGRRPFGTGSGRYCKYILRGAWQTVPFCAFQYQYTVSTGKSSHTYHFVVLDLEMPLDGHGLSIQREHVGHKIFDALGGEDIDFESAEFSKRFWVRADDRRFAYDVVHPAMMEWLLAHPKHHWQWHGRSLLLHQTGHMDVPVVRSLLADAMAFRELLPRHRLATD